MDLLSGLGKFGADPLGGLIDMGANALGLPPVVANAAKTVVGVYTGNPVTAFNGATGLIGDLAELAKNNPPARTEYCCKRGDVDGPEGYAAPPTSNGRGKVGGADSNLPDFKDALTTLWNHWDTFDSASGRADQYITRDDLKAVLFNPEASPELKSAARFLLKHPEYFDRLEMAAGFGGKDGIVGKGDVGAERERVDREIAASGAGRAAPPENEDPIEVHPPRDPGGDSSEIGRIARDPNLSLEEKIFLILSKIMDGIDDEILNTMEDLDKAKDKVATDKDKAKDGKGSNAAGRKAEKNADQLQLRLQKLTERRQQMFQLMSNMSEKFNEMAKTALSNLSRA